MECCTDPKPEIFEYLKRDLANVALGNKDNHTCNTAIQRFNDGTIRLFPCLISLQCGYIRMVLHEPPAGKKDDHGGMPIWHSVIEQITEQTGIEHQEIQSEFVKQLPLYQGLMDEMHRLQISEEILQNSQYRIENICQQIQELAYG